MSMMTARRRRSFTPEFKAQTVDLLRTSGKSVGEVCRDLDLTETVVRRWLAQTDIDAGRRDGSTTVEREELAMETNRWIAIGSSRRRRPSIRSLSSTGWWRSPQ